MADYNTTLDYLRKLCSAREYCRKDIEAKASARLENEADIQKAVAALEKEGYLDESRYAISFARDKSSLAGWGSIKIRYMLNAKGLDKTVIDNALNETDCAKAEEKLRRILEIKYNSLKEDAQVKLKLLKFALSRGYTYDEVNKAVNEILHR